MGGRTGRRRLPTALTLLRGERRPSRVNPSEPKPPNGCPPKPPHVTGIAAKEWARLARLAEDMGVLTTADAPILEATALAYGEYRAALKASGGRPTYRTRTKAGGWMVRAHPAVAIAADAWRRWVLGLGHFGLSPATRSKVSAAPRQRDGKLDRYFFGPRDARWVPPELADA